MRDWRLIYYLTVSDKALDTICKHQHLLNEPGSPMFDDIRGGLRKIEAVAIRLCYTYQSRIQWRLP